MPHANRHGKWTHDNWCEPFCSAWKIAIAPGDVFREGGPANKLKARTVWNYEIAFGRYQEFLTQSGRRDQHVLPDLDNLRGFDAELSTTLSPYSQLAILTQLIGALRLMFPSADLRYLSVVAARKASIAQATRPVEQRLISPVDLIKVGLTMMIEVGRKGELGTWDPNRFMVGALINAAALFPLRHNNWHMVIIGQHIDFDTGDVRFSADEMKRQKPFKGTLSPEALTPLRIFVETYRPLMLNPDAVDQGFLFPSRAGGMCHRNTLGKAVKIAIRRRTGKEFNFHLFRHAAATFISETKPEQTSMVAGVLHHSNLSMANKYYIKGKRRRAFQLFQGAVREVISKGRRRLARQQSKRQRLQSANRGKTRGKTRGCK